MAIEAEPKKGAFTTDALRERAGMISYGDSSLTNPDSLPPEPVQGIPTPGPSGEEMMGIRIPDPQAVKKRTRLLSISPEKSYVVKAVQQQIERLTDAPKMFLLTTGLNPEKAPVSAKNIRAIQTAEKIGMFLKFHFLSNPLSLQQAQRLFTQIQITHAAIQSEHLSIKRQYPNALAFADSADNVRELLAIMGWMLEKGNNLLTQTTKNKVSMELLEMGGVPEAKQMLRTIIESFTYNEFTLRKLDRRMGTGLVDNPEPQNPTTGPMMLPANQASAPLPEGFVIPDTLDLPATPGPLMPPAEPEKGRLGPMISLQTDGESITAEVFRGEDELVDPNMPETPEDDQYAREVEEMHRKAEKALEEEILSYHAQPQSPVDPERNISMAPLYPVTGTSEVPPDSYIPPTVPVVTTEPQTQDPDFTAAYGVDPQTPRPQEDPDRQQDPIVHEDPERNVISSPRRGRPASGTADEFVFTTLERMRQQLKELHAPTKTYGWKMRELLQAA